LFVALFGKLKLEKHPDKTLICRVERGFDFLGYFLKRNSLGVSEKTVERFMERIVRLYEQEPLDRREKRLGQYALRWFCWVRSGLWLLLDRKSFSNPSLSANVVTPFSVTIPTPHPSAMITSTPVFVRSSKYKIMLALTSVIGLRSKTMTPTIIQNVSNFFILTPLF
jgi:hypothetical protein